MSKSHLPPVPPDQRAPGPNTADATRQAKESDAREQQHQRGENQNLGQNTHHQGFQQDR